MRNKKSALRTGPDWLIKMAWRDARSGKRKLVLFIASIIFGVAAVVSIQSFGNSLRENISLQSKSLMGADFVIDSNSPPGVEVQKVLDSLGGAQAKEISFSSMVAFPGAGATKLVQVRGIAGGFPFYGKIETVPDSAAWNYQVRKSALVDATLMAQFGLNPGDSVKIGDLTLPIVGAVKSVPGSSSIFSSIAPPVLMPHSLISRTNLVKKGSRIEYSYYFTAGPGEDLEKLDKKLDKSLEQFDADIDTHLSTSERLGRRYENFGKFLNLIAFIALLLGSVGIASAMYIYIKRKLKAVAVLKCLGATRKQAFSIYLIQIAAMGFIGGVIGTFAGLLLQQLFPLIVADLLPVSVELVISAQIIVMGVLLGMIIAVLFACYPLTGTLFVSPLRALRVQEGTPTGSRKAKFFISGGIILFMLLFSLWLLEDWKYSLAFVVSIAVVFSILAGLASLMIKGVRRFFPYSWSFVGRQSLLNLFRPQNQTLTLVLAIGVGAFLISTLYFTKDMLLAQASLEEQDQRPNMILLDVQTGQEEEVIQTVAGQDLEVISNIPIVTMRVHSIAGIPTNELRQDSTSGINDWVLNHEFRVTYRDSLIDSEKIVEGELKAATTGEAIPISVSQDFADDAQVSLGEEITFNVQGVLMETRVRSIRLVDWARMQLNFSLVFPQGPLDQAPQFRVLTTKVPTEESSAELQRELVQKFPNISILDLRQIMKVVEGILTKVSWLINFMAFFSIIMGVIVLLGAIRTSKYQRIRENVLLRTLGARSRQIMKMTALEYLYLGVFGSLSGVLLSLIGSQILAWFLFDATFRPSLVPFVIIFPVLSLLVLLIGIGNNLGVLKRSPLEVLRKTGQ